MDLGDVSAALATTGGMHRLREPACMSLFEFRHSPDRITCAFAGQGRGPSVAGGGPLSLTRWSVAPRVGSAASVHNCQGRRCIRCPKSERGLVAKADAAAVGPTDPNGTLGDGPTQMPYGSHLAAPRLASSSGRSTQ